jgi:Na+-driven multidrug efflux pump
MAQAVMTIIAFGIFFRGTNLVMLAGILRAGGDTRYAFLADVGTAYFVGIPLAAIGAFVLGLPIQWVYTAAITEEIVKFGLNLRRVLSERWVHNVVRQV